MYKNEFLQFNLDEKLMQGVMEAGFKSPSPVQKEAIPAVLKKCDIIAQAHTGTGKTAAFGLPIMHMMSFDKKTETLIITPTRELAMQISDELYRLGKYMGAKTTTIYGGQSYSRQIKQIGSANIVVATPGRLLDLLNSKQISIKPNFIVLDEADEMLDMGFLDDIEKILSHTPKDAQKLLFSATMPAPIRKISQKFLHNPQTIQITQEQTTNKDIAQEYYVVQEHERQIAAIRLIDYYDPQKTILFCRMKKEASDLAHDLLAKGYPAKALHGDMEQREREATIRSFKRGEVEILVATDVAARGLDISDLSHVFNYHIPFDPQSYVHRIGRTGRAGKKGVAITLVSPSELRELQKIKQLVGDIMVHKFIPSSDELENDFYKKLGEKISLQEVDKKARNLVLELKQELGLEELATKLCSMIIDNQGIEGPKHIGLDPKRTKELMQRFKSSQQRRKNSRSKDNRGYKTRSSKKPAYKTKRSNQKRQNKF